MCEGFRDEMTDSRDSPISFESHSPRSESPNVYSPRGLSVVVHDASAVSVDPQLRARHHSITNQVFFVHIFLLICCLQPVVLIEDKLAQLDEYGKLTTQVFCVHV